MNKNNNCIFCHLIEEKKSYIIGENKNCLSILDIYPLVIGHSLIISKKHFNDLKELDKKHWNAMLSLIKETIEKLSIFKPLGFKIINNLGKEAGQEIFHFHFHLLPKYKEYNLNNIEKNNLARIFEEITKKK